MTPAPPCSVSALGFSRWVAEQAMPAVSRASSKPLVGTGQGCSHRQSMLRTYSHGCPEGVLYSCVDLDLTASFFGSTVGCCCCCCGLLLGGHTCSWADPDLLINRKLSSSLVLPNSLMICSLNRYVLQTAALSLRASSREPCRMAKPAGLRLSTSTSS